MVDTSNTPSLGLLHLVNQSRFSLLPIIQAHTLPGIIIHSDDFFTYRNTVGQLPSVAQHQTVNHSFNLVDPESGVHTQHMESYWNKVKQKYKQIIEFKRANYPVTWMSLCGVNGTVGMV